MPKQEYRLSRKKTKNQLLTFWEVPVNKVRSRLPRSEPAVGRARTTWLVAGTENISRKFARYRRTDSAHRLMLAAFCCCLHPHCKGGLMQAANSGPSTATIPLGMLLVSGDSRVAWLRSCVPRVLHRAALPRHPSMPGMRCAGARSPSLIRSSGTAVWGVRSIVAAQMAACPACRPPSRWA